MPTVAFQNKCKASTAEPRLRLTVGTTRHIDDIVSVSALEYSIYQITGQAAVTVDNSDKSWNTLFGTNTAIGGTASIGLYFPDDNETLWLFKGTVYDVRYKDAYATLIIDNKFADRLNKVVNTGTNSQERFGTVWATYDIVWDLLTTYCNLDATKDYTNPDIDYGSFTSWRDNHIIKNNYRLSVFFHRENVRDILDYVGFLTQSYIWMNKENKVQFAPDYVTGQTYTASNIIGIPSLLVTTRNMINSLFTRYGYLPHAPKWIGDKTVNTLASQTIFGIYKYTEDYLRAYHWNEASALQFGTEMASNYAYPERIVTFYTNLTGILDAPGNKITFTHDHLGASGDTMYITDISIHLVPGSREVCQITARWPW